MLRYTLLERRKFYRVYIRLPITYEVINAKDNTTKAKDATALDLSLDSIYFKTDEVLPLGLGLNIRFQLPKAKGIIQAAIKVARVEAIEKESGYGTGAEFVNLSEGNKDEIKRFVEQLNIHKLLEATIKKGASDLHLATGLPPVVRVNGELVALNMPKLEDEDIAYLMYSIMSREQIKRFERDKELDFGIQFDMGNRFRVNLHQQRGFPEATLRLINTSIDSLEELKIPEVVKDFARLKDGLVLISGPTGSGKSTTIAAMVEIVNRERTAVVITLERPIEYVHTHIKSIIKQREVGIDTDSFSIALKSSLRQDPNVIVVGELDDAETIKTAIAAAEAGYLVIASFHAPNSMQTIDRLASIFPAENRRQVLSQLSNCLKGIVTQVLIPRIDKPGRVLASEVIVVTDAAKRIIRHDELIQLPNIIQTGASYKMQTMSDIVKKYLQQGIIDEETAKFYSEEFSKYG